MAAIKIRLIYLIYSPLFSIFSMNQKSDKISDKPVALITGASRGIGAAMALQLAKAGYHCIIAARSIGGLEEVDDAIRSLKIKDLDASATIAALDLRAPEMIDALAAQIYERYGRLDALIGNGAMLGTLTPVAHQDPTEFETVFQVNTLANQRLIRVMDPLLKRSQSPRVVMVTSSAASHPHAYWGAYAASKAALNQLTLIYAAEVAHTPIKVNLLDPGATRTAMRQSAFPGENPNSLKTPDKVAQAMMALLGDDAPHGTILRVEA
jgi:NAD(P)-dependent dehydrogenase (short-subunit alcohol dehydrogenase family)